MQPGQNHGTLAPPGSNSDRPGGVAIEGVGVKFKSLEELRSRTVLPISTPCCFPNLLTLPS